VVEVLAFGWPLLTTKDAMHRTLLLPYTLLCGGLPHALGVLTSEVKAE